MYSDKRNPLLQKRFWYSVNFTLSMLGCGIVDQTIFFPSLFSMYIINNCIDNECALTLMYDDSSSRLRFSAWIHLVWNVLVILQSCIVMFLFLSSVALSGYSWQKLHSTNLEGKVMNQEKNLLQNVASCSSTGNAVFKTLLTDHSFLSYKASR